MIIPIIAITTNSSINVNAAAPFILFLADLLLGLSINDFTAFSVGSDVALPSVKLVSFDISFTLYPPNA